MLQLKNLHVSVCDKTSCGGLRNGKKIILNGVSLSAPQGEIHAVMGPNGSGKSTLAYAVMGHPKYKVLKGHILWNSQNITRLPPEKRAAAGLFLGFQYPQAAAGVTVFSFIMGALRALKKNKNAIDPAAVRKELNKHLTYLRLNETFAERYLNEGFSGGEKKKMEILQMLMCKPKLAILDEPDSGLDIDSLKTAAEAIKKFGRSKPQKTVILITHSCKILKHIQPDKVHVMINGALAASGGRELPRRLEQKGYGWLKNPVKTTEAIHE